MNPDEHELESGVTTSPGRGALRQVAAPTDAGNATVLLSRRKLLVAGALAAAGDRAVALPSMPQTFLIEGVSRMWPATDRAMVVLQGVGATACIQLARLASGYSIRGESGVLWVPCTPDRARQGHMLINVGESTRDATVGLTGGHWDTHVDLAAATGQGRNVRGQLAAAEAIAAMVLTDTPVAVDLEDVSMALGVVRASVFANCTRSGVERHVRAARFASKLLNHQLSTADGVLVSITAPPGNWWLTEAKYAMNAVSVGAA